MTYLNLVPFLAPFHMGGGCFSSSHCGKLKWALEVNLITIVGPLILGCPWDFQSCPDCTSAIQQLLFQVFLQHSFWGGFHNESLPVSLDSSMPYFLGLPCDLFSVMGPEELLFLNLFSFSLVRMECHLTNSLFVNQEIGTSSVFI